MRIAALVCKSLFGMSVVFLTTIASSPQSLLLPSVSGAVTGSGTCAGRSLQIASERWRVKKGEVFSLRAAQPFDDDYEWKYVWHLDNGEIVKGQGTRELTVKAGGKRTPGYLNADGFIRVSLDVDSADGSNCSLSARTSIMIGKHREWNGHANVDHLQVSTTEVHAGCDQTPVPAVDVRTTASDPENDVLTYTYLVSAGRIVRVGAQVRWDLSGVPPGPHRIAVGVNDGSGVVGKTKAATITVRPCGN